MRGYKFTTERVEKDELRAGKNKGYDVATYGDNTAELDTKEEFERPCSTSLQIQTSNELTFHLETKTCTKTLVVSKNVTIALKMFVVVLLSLALTEFQIHPRICILS